VTPRAGGFRALPGLLCKAPASFASFGASALPVDFPSRGAQCVRQQGENPGSFARETSHRVAEGASHHRDADLADTAGRLVARNQLDVNFIGRLRHARRPVGVKITFLQLAILDIDLLVQRGTQSHDGGAFDLRDDRVRIDDHTGVDRNPRPVHANLTGVAIQ